MVNLAVDAPKPLTQWLLAAGCLLTAGTVAAVYAAAGRAAGPFDPIAVALVLTGGLGYVLLTHGPDELSALRRGDAAESAGDGRWVARRLVEICRTYRCYGLPGIEDELDRAGTALERHGLALIACGMRADELDEPLRQHSAVLADAERLPGRVWLSLSRGFVNTGVVVGLAALSTDLAAASLTAGALAAAVAPMVVGLVLGRAIAEPVAARLNRAAERADAVRELWIEGLVAIAADIHPRRLAERLSCVA